MVKKLSNQILISIAVVAICGSILIVSAFMNNGNTPTAIASPIQQATTSSPELIAQNNTQEDSMDLSNATTTDSGLKYIVIEQGKIGRASCRERVCTVV